MALPDKIWHFDRIALCAPTRAAALESAESPAELVKAISIALERELDRGKVRFGNEHAPECPADARAVVQFHVDAHLFDWFANARTGYRAQFRRGWEQGLAFNYEIILALRSRLDEVLPSVVPVRELKGEFEDFGVGKVPKAILLASLLPDLSKVWVCTKLIGLNGGTEYLPFGSLLLGPRLLLGEGLCWPAL